MLHAFAVQAGQYFLRVPHRIADAFTLIVGLLLLVVWYVRGRRHKALLTSLKGLLDGCHAETQIINPVGIGEDNIQGHWGGRDILLSVKEPVKSTEFPLFRIILGSRTSLLFSICIQKKLLFGLVSTRQPGRSVVTGCEGLDKRYHITNLMMRTSKGVQNRLDARLTSWLRLPETLHSFDTLFRSCGVDYLCTQIEYPGRVQFAASKSGLTAILRHYSKRQVSSENVRRILEQMSLLVQSAEGLLELDGQGNGSGR